MQERAVRNAGERQLRSFTSTDRPEFMRVFLLLRSGPPYRPIKTAELRRVEKTRNFHNDARSFYSGYISRANFQFRNFTFLTAGY